LLRPRGRWARRAVLTADDAFRADIRDTISELKKLENSQSTFEIYEGVIGCGAASCFRLCAAARGW
jgi:hypothetical protein